MDDAAGPVHRPTLFRRLRGLRFSGEVGPPALMRLLEDPKSEQRLWWGLGALALIFAIPPIYNNAYFLLNKDYDLWYWTGWFYRKGLLIYPRQHKLLFPFMYPPSCAWLLAIATKAGDHGYMLVLLAINTIAWVLSIVFGVDLATGGRAGLAAWKKRRVVLALLPTLCMVPYIHDTYLLGQPSLLLLALMLGGFVALRKGKEVHAGAAIGLAAAIKAYPVMALVYLVYRKQWKASAAMCATLILLLFVAPLTIRTRAQVAEDFTLWTKGMVLKYDEKTIAQRPERCYSFKNQSIVALENRLLRNVPADGEADLFWRVNIASLSFRATNILIAATGLAICLGFVGAMPARRIRSDKALGLETSMLLSMILFFAPLSFNYSYVWLLYPMMIQLALLIEAPEGSADRRRAGIALAWSIGLLALSAAVPKTSQAYGNVLLSGLVLWASQGQALWMEKRALRNATRGEGKLSPRSPHLTQTHSREAPASNVPPIADTLRERS